jgi:hypothetical protein
MSLTYHKIINNMSTWIKKTYILKSITTYIHQIQCKELLKLKNMDLTFVYAFTHMYSCLWFLFGLFYV